MGARCVLHILFLATLFSPFGTLDMKLNISLHTCSSSIYSPPSRGCNVTTVKCWLHFDTYPADNAPLHLPLFGSRYLHTFIPRKTFLLFFQFCIIALGCSCRHVHFRWQANIKDIPTNRGKKSHATSWLYCPNIVCCHLHAWRLCHVSSPSASRVI